MGADGGVCKISIRASIQLKLQPCFTVRHSYWGASFPSFSNIQTMPQCLYFFVSLCSEITLSVHLLPRQDQQHCGCSSINNGWLPLKAHWELWVWGCNLLPGLHLHVLTRPCDGGTGFWTDSFEPATWQPSNMTRLKEGWEWEDKGGGEEEGNEGPCLETAVLQVNVQVDKWFAVNNVIYSRTSIGHKYLSYLHLRPVCICYI